MADTSPKKVIKALSKEDIRSIQSAQVIPTLAICVKELVENALDSGATSLEVRFKNKGLDSVEVIDNGCGIDPKYYETICRRHTTSKLKAFEDLESVTSFGFRGEALNSICTISEKVTINTCTDDDGGIGTYLEFNNRGELQPAAITKAAKKRGTTVIFHNPFFHFKPRQKTLAKNIANEYRKALNMLEEYAIISTGVKFTVNCWFKGKKSEEFKTQGSTSLLDNVRAVSNAGKDVKALIPLDVDFSFKAEKSVLNTLSVKAKTTDVKVKGLISTPSTGHGRSKPDRQHFYINGRPCDNDKLSKAFNEVYKRFNMNQYPWIVADFSLPTDTYDVNITPDKRQVLLHSESSFIEALKEGLEEAFGPYRSMYPMSQIGLSRTPSTSLQLPSSTSSRTSSNAPVNELIEDSHEDNTSSQAQDVELEEVDELEEDPKEVGERVASAVAPRTTPKARVGSPDVIAIDSEVEEVEEVEEGDQRHHSRDIGSIFQDAPETQPLFVADDDEDEDVVISLVQPSESSVQSRVSVQRTGSQQVQMTLDTRGASWAMKRKGEGDADPGVPKKKKSKDGGGLEGAIQHVRRFAAQTRRDVRKYLDLEAAEGSAEDEDEEMDPAIEVEEDNQEGTEGDQDELVDEEDDVQETFKDTDEERLDHPELKASDPSVDSKTGKGGLSLRGNAGRIISIGDNDDESLSSSPSSTFQTIELEADHGRPGVADSSGVEPEDESILEERAANLQALADGDRSGSQGAPLPSFRDEIANALEAGERTVSFDLGRIRAAWKRRSAIRLTTETSRTKPKTGQDGANDTLVEASVEQTSEQAVETLSRHVAKEDFANMSIVGQFNKGFIIARRTVAVGGDLGEDEGEQCRDDDLFIVDQHASDEKYNFERLQAETIIKCQKLLHPRPINLTPGDESLAIEIQDVIKANGFEIAIDEEEPVGRRIKLLAQPVSKGTTLGPEDLQDLLFRIREGPTGTVMRCSKLERMFAMRACRTSVMIGSVLTEHQMSKIVRHMGTMAMPWSCPHGRPTMRWLSNVDTNRKDPRLTTFSFTRDKIKKLQEALAD